MKFSRTYRILTELVILIDGISLVLLTKKHLFGRILIYVGLTALIIDFIVRLMQKKLNIQNLAIIFTIFSILNFMRHMDFYILITGLNKLLGIEFEIYFVQESIWLIPTIAMIWIIFFLFKNKDTLEFQQFIRTKKFQFAILFIFIAILLEAPIFGLHQNSAGIVHGHAFWDAWTHVH